MKVKKQLSVYLSVKEIKDIIVKHLEEEGVCIEPSDIKFVINTDMCSYDKEIFYTHEVTGCDIVRDI